MGTSVLRRGVGAVLLGAATCALTLPATAHAEEGSDPIISGECAATFESAEGTPITADPGAAAEAPGVLTLGTGSESAGTNKHAEPLVTVPVSDTLDEVGVSRTPVVSDTAGGACRVAKPVLNGAGAAAQEIVPGDDVTEPGEDGPLENRPPNDEPQENPPGEAPGEDDETPDPDSGAGSIAPGTTSDGVNDSADTDLPGALDDTVESLGSITLPPPVSEPPVQAPDLNPNVDTDPPKDQADESGNAQAVPSSDSPQRLPLLLAVIALALVVAALSKSFYSRTST